MTDTTTQGAASPTDNDLLPLIRKYESWVDGPLLLAHEIPARWGGPQAAALPTWTLVSERLPEPGKAVLLDIGKQVPIRALWAAQHTVECGAEDSDWCDSDESDVAYCPEGWYEWNEHEPCHWAVSATPIAWMEMPATLSTITSQAEGAQP